MAAQSLTSQRPCFVLAHILFPSCLPSSHSARVPPSASATTRCWFTPSWKLRWPALAPNSPISSSGHDRQRGAWYLLIRRTRSGRARLADSANSYMRNDGSPTPIAATTISRSGSIPSAIRYGRSTWTSVSAGVVRVPADGWGRVDRSKYASHVSASVGKFFHPNPGVMACRAYANRSAASRPLARYARSRY